MQKTYSFNIFIPSPIWTIGEQIINNVFEVVQETKVSEVWDLLQKQRILTPTTLDFNLNISHQAWKIAATSVDERKDEPKKTFFWKIGSNSSSKHNDSKKTKGTEEEEVDSTSILSDNALKTWVMAYLLN